jgi:hypothetical protein
VQWDSLPVGDGFAEPLLGLADAGTVSDVNAWIDLAEGEDRIFSLAQDEISQHAVAVPLERDRGS